jgi:hypothetical protein
VEGEEGANRVQERVHDSLESIGFRRFDAIEVLPGERVAGDEAGEDVVASEHADDCPKGCSARQIRKRGRRRRTSESEKRKPDAVSEKFLVVDVRAIVRVFERFPGDVADDGADSAGEGNLVEPGVDYPVLKGGIDGTAGTVTLHEENGDEEEGVAARGKVVSKEGGKERGQSTHPSPSLAPLSAEMMSRTAFGTC